VHTNPGKATVDNLTGKAYAGTKYVNADGSGTHFRRLVDEDMGSLTEVSFFFLMCDLYGGAGGGDAFLRYWMSGGEYPPSTFISTEVFDSGTLCYSGISRMGSGRRPSPAFLAILPQIRGSASVFFACWKAY